MTEHSETETIKINSTHYCSYCWQPAKKATEWQDRDEEIWWYCTCEMAEKEVERKVALRVLKRTYEMEVNSIESKWKTSLNNMSKSRIYWKSKYATELKELRKHLNMQLAIIEECKDDK